MVDQLPEAHAIIFRTPTPFGNMAAPMCHFPEQTGGLWARGALVGKVGSVFASTATQTRRPRNDADQFPYPLLHHDMVIVGVP